MSLKEVNIPQNRNRIAGLNSLRFFAFLAVFLFHTTSVFRLGFLGVDFFFVLSSFLLTYLAFNEIERSGGFSQKNFFIRRVLRIFPLYFLIVFFSFIVLPWIATSFGFKVTLPENKLFYWTFLSNYEFSKTILPLRFLWSVAVEEQFYLLFLLLSFFFENHFKWILTGLYFGYFIYMLLALKNGWNNYDALGAHLIKFAVGMTAGWCFFNQKNSAVFSYLGFLISSILLFSLSWGDSIWKLLFFNIFLSIWFGFLILTSIKICRFFKKKHPFRLTEYFGKFTYGLYIYSGFIIISGIRFFPETPKIFLLPAEFILLFIVSFLSYHFFEKRFLRLKKYFRKVA